ncbi:HNH endonuclease [Phenylobacterium sp.]|uniref:HNH endonuclease n=1 Tax=Phenylobacterium sp. TaxID=1871053 RepID=UPI002737C909|nr:HNH endonuclease [Phenylobacterium sp.]MDP3870429.1 HNH endonuclease [Phenylobacterium sp.]
MAVTRGHGNPNWNRDETILALEAYFALAGKNPSAKDPQIIALSQTLRALPYHGTAARKPTFRNPDGAAFKVQNLRSRETGKGLSNVSRMDREIWEELGANPAEVTRLATLIRAGIVANLDTAPQPVDEAEDVEFYEGRLLTQSHIRRERSASLRKALLKKRQGDALHCDVCGQAHAALPPELRAAAFEAHHIVPIATAGEGPTKLSDVALLCATCHRLLHRLIALKREWVGLTEAKASILGSPTPPP